MVVGPDEVSVKRRIKGKSIVTLQTCTLPNYKDRLIVQAELVSSN
jgi:sortase A